jgi:Subtilase family
MAEGINFYIVILANEHVQERYRANDVGALKALIREHLDLGLMSPFEVADAQPLPSNRVHPAVSPAPEPSAIEPLVVPLTVGPQIFEKLGGRASDSFFVGGGVNIPFAAADHWCPAEAANPIFANRAAAERLLGAPYPAGAAASGRDVNVVVVDQGLNRARLGPRYGGGWRIDRTDPGTARPRSGTVSRTHGMMIADNITHAAPEVTLFDLPLVPPTKSDYPSRISDIPVFLDLAHAAFLKMLHQIRRWRANGRYPGPWILVNPWAIFDTKTDLAPPHDYGSNPDHVFNRLIADTVDDGIDVVFSAGNCGQFCPDRRCGETDRGPGHSIWGANSHPRVLTFGAVRSDGMWLGYSSQGPGQSRLDTPAPGQPNHAHDKPDLCVPSQFSENDDAFTVNTGTSAACALATGVVAALRSKWRAGHEPQPSPDELKDLLIRTARKTNGQYWDGRFGHGILDAKAAYVERFGPLA